MKTTSKTFVLKPADVTRKWVVIDASTAPLGRVATTIATRLIGKYQPTFTPHVDSGDNVVVINADKLVVTGKKLDQKTYYRHSGFPGGITATTLGEQVEKDSTKVIYAAVKGMLPRNKLAADRLQRLRVFAGEAHNHNAQQPEVIEVVK
ncbi:50S ribosomal protein L13 [Candidatus Saccharibacteria bacterium]|nr:50S ribosomal protein L13 [Candidatus Saccharibacteria bacterium]